MNNPKNCRVIIIQLSSHNHRRLGMILCLGLIEYVFYQRTESNDIIKRNNNDTLNSNQDPRT